MASAVIKDIAVKQAITKLVNKGLDFIESLRKPKTVKTSKPFPSFEKETILNETILKEEYLTEEYLTEKYIH